MALCQILTLVKGLGKKQTIQTVNKMQPESITSLVIYLCP